MRCICFCLRIPFIIFGLHFVHDFACFREMSVFFCAVISVSNFPLISCCLNQKCRLSKNLSFLGHFSHFAVILMLEMILPGLRT